jgi:osmotically-inducible protein OsmY
MHKPNLLLESDVEEELMWDPQLDASRIVVKATDGAVTLSGSVPTYFEVTRAGDDVYQVGGVKGLDNQLLVGLLGDAVTDGDIAIQAAAALNADRLVPKGSVQADVLEGYVTLTGRVRHHFERQAAEHAVRKVDGLLGMSDEISISADPVPSDVADRINKAFQRSSTIDDSLITVSNQGPTIYLDGTAGSWTARQEAEDTAWAAPGVTNVVNRLEIVPS